MLDRIKTFLDNELWLLADKLVGYPKIGVRALQVIVVTIQDFITDKCSIRAAALTYYSALSLVPILALLFGIAKGFGFEEMLRQKLLASGGSNQDMLIQMFAFAENTLANAKGGVVAGIGIILLFYTLLKTIGLIENAFNDIWDIQVPRTLLRKFTDYLSLLLITPILLIFSGSVTVFIGTNTQAIAHKLGIGEIIGPALNFALNLTPYILIWAMFLGFYMIMPNKNVKFKAALIGAIVAGSVYQITNWIYITFQVGVSSYNGIYGSFAALPLFLVWVQLSWTIVLFGAELSFAIQNMDELIRTYKKNNMSVVERFKYSVVILRNLLKHTTDNVPYVTAEMVSKELNIGLDKTINILHELKEKNLVVSIENGEKIEFQPARDSRDLNLYYIIETLLKDNSQPLPMEHQDVDEWVEILKADLKSSKGNVFLISD